MDKSTIDIIAVLLPLIPTVPMWAFVIERLVELGKAQGFIEPGKAAFWSAGLNALAYIAMFMCSQLGYETAATDVAVKVTALWPVISAAVTLAVLAASSTGLSKLVHELIKKLPEKAE